jgi:polyhydroxyalkanoate synthesis regulator phasin
MSDEQPPQPPQVPQQPGGTPGPRARPMGIGEGIRSGIGILAAFREAVEETITEALERNDVRPDRAREAVGTAMERMQTAFDDVRERVDVVPRKEFDALRAEVEALRARLEALEGRAGGAAAGGSTLPGDVGSPGIFGGGPTGTVDDAARGVIDQGGL